MREIMAASAKFLAARCLLMAQSPAPLDMPAPPGRWPGHCMALWVCLGIACWAPAAKLNSPEITAFEQRFRLQAEGVIFRGRRVDMKQHEFKFGKTKGVSKETRSSSAGSISLVATR